MYTIGWLNQCNSMEIRLTSDMRLRNPSDFPSQKSGIAKLQYAFASGLENKAT